MRTKPTRKRGRKKKTTLNRIVETAVKRRSDKPLKIGPITVGSVDYQTYMRSEAWRYKRKLALHRAEGRCQLCNGVGRLHVHHRTYERLGNEKLSDLTVLCERCHKVFHALLNLVVE